MECGSLAAAFLVFVPHSAYIHAILETNDLLVPPYPYKCPGGMRSGAYNF